MIISMNATVCAAMNHGEQLAVHDHLQRAREDVPEGDKTAMNSG
jgi:hypothetical protein